MRITSPCGRSSLRKLSHVSYVVARVARSRHGGEGDQSSLTCPGLARSCASAGSARIFEIWRGVRYAELEASDAGGQHKGGGARPPHD